MAPDQITRRSLLRRGAGAAVVAVGRRRASTPPRSPPAATGGSASRASARRCASAGCPWTATCRSGCRARSCATGPRCTRWASAPSTTGSTGSGCSTRSPSSAAAWATPTASSAARPTRPTKEEGIIRYSEFATDPCRAIFNGAQATFSLAKVRQRQRARRAGSRSTSWRSTEVGLPVRFDPRTLRTLGVVGPEPPLGQIETVHPHRLEGGRRVFYDIPLIPPARYQVKVARGTARAAAAGRDPAQGARLHALVRAHRAARGAHRVAVRGGPAEDHHGLGAVHPQLPLGAVARRELLRRGPPQRPGHAARDRPAVHLPPRERVRARRQDLPRHVRLRRRRRDRRALPREAPRAAAARPRWPSCGATSSTSGRKRVRMRPLAEHDASSCRGSTTGA